MTPELLQAFLLGVAVGLVLAYIIPGIVDLWMRAWRHQPEASVHHRRRDR